MKYALHSLLVLCLVLLGGTLADVRAEDGPAAFVPVEGRDYVTLANGAPYQAAGQGVEVAEVFSYRCIHCAHLAPLLETWKRRQKSDVRVVYVPLPYGRDDMLARGFFAASDAGALGRTHAAVFRAIHDTGELPANPGADEMAAYYATLGLDRDRMRAALTDDAVLARLLAAHRFAVDKGVDGTPTLIISGRYRVLGQPSFDRTLRVADALIARARAEAHAAP